MSHPSGLPSFLLPYFFKLTLTKLQLEGWVETLIPITNLVFVSTIRPMARGFELGVFKRLETVKLHIGELFVFL